MILAKFQAFGVVLDRFWRLLVGFDGLGSSLLFWYHQARMDQKNPCRFSK